MAKTVGDFGEDLTALLLQNEFKGQGVKILRVGADNQMFDRMVLEAAGTPFLQPSVISVKTRGEWSDVIPYTENN